MAPRKSQSFFNLTTSRELNSFRVRKRPNYDGWFHGFLDVGAVATQHNGEDVVPLALSFAKTSKFCHILALSNEEGYVSFFDTRRKFAVPQCLERNAEEARICEWSSHNNAVFDVNWIKDDTQILTASGDQTVKVWDVQEKKCLGVLTGHTGSVKSISSHPTNPDILVSGSRDGSFRLWDLRCNSNSNRRGEVRICSTDVVNGAHILYQGLRPRRGKVASNSVTSVLWLKDQVSIATAGAVNSVVKFWDTRNLKSIVTQACPEPGKQRLHGISSLSQDDSGLLLSASCMDSRVYLYNTLQLEKGALRYFEGGRIESFFIKAAISPDASNIVCGSSNAKAYVWQVDKPQVEPTILKSHYEEVTAVDWCRSDNGKLATASDDFSIHIWNKRSSVTTSKTPFSIRRRVMAIPRTECKMLLDNEETCPKSSDYVLLSNEEPNDPVKSATPITPPKTTTSEGHKNQLLSEFDLTISPKNTPESALKSPSSVLNPPPSLKRTIRDYFVASS
ncbi:putative transcription factor WD40-like family [Medicago truncatula]|uniref:Denticleless-like protein n=1 Tax=Medicago truncatula TaxID=3880 RepID=G7KQ08_MEDTR|nr:denticleless protein homolog [Medicago truncatula]AES74373.1 denticleless-like protein [Medicago truncatula]RHN49728.1 putative transcription factor WD40-like family [Medicago truncatula]